MSCETVEILKESEKSRVALIYDGEHRQMLVEKRLKGELPIYRQLLGLSHPYLPKIYQVEFQNGETIVLEEYISGGSLVEVRAREKQVRKWLLELCQVLSFLHRQGIVHRDIKPSNLLLGSDGHIRLIDFDAAREEKKNADSDTRLLGTRGYAPPEQYGFSQTDQRADIYALGVTFRELLGPAGKKLRWRHILKKCTALEPKRRYRNAFGVRLAIILRRFRRRVVYPVLALLFAFITGFFAVSFLTDQDFAAVMQVVLASRRSLVFETVDIDACKKSPANLPAFSGSEKAAYHAVSGAYSGLTFISTGYADESGNLLFGGFSTIYQVDTGERFYRRFEGLYALTESGSVRQIVPEDCLPYAPAIQKLYELDVFDTPIF